MSVLLKQQISECKANKIISRVFMVVMILFCILGMGDVLLADSNDVVLDLPETQGKYVFDTDWPELRWEPNGGPGEVLIPYNDPNVSVDSNGIAVFSFNSFEVLSGVLVEGVGFRPLRIDCNETIGFHDI